MKLIGIQPLRGFTKKHADAKAQIESWEAETSIAQWNTPVSYTHLDVYKRQHCGRMGKRMGSLSGSATMV